MKTIQIIQLFIVFTLLIMNCKDNTTNPITTQLTPLNLSTAKGVWRQFKIETYQDSQIQSSIQISDTGIEQVYLDIDSSHIFLNWIYRRIKCTEDYAWQHSVCDTLPPCRTLSDMINSVNEFSSTDTFIVRELHIATKNGNTMVERRYMKRYLNQFPPAQYQDTCLFN